MRIVILDDYQDAVRSLAAFGKLDGHTVHVYNDTAKDEDALVERLREAEAVVLVRQRTRLGAALLARAAVSAGVDAVFLECHPEPRKSASDAATIQALDAVPALLAQLKAVREACRGAIESERAR